MLLIALGRINNNKKWITSFERESSPMLYFALPLDFALSVETFNNRLLLLLKSNF